MQDKQKIIDKIFQARGTNGCWKMLPENNKYYPACLHYVPNYKATLWTLILLADLGCDKSHPGISKPLHIILDHFFDPVKQIFSIGTDHFPIPCLNGNMMYLDCYFNGTLGDRSKKALDFFCKNQRFDDGVYELPENEYCSNKSCYGKHTCYWGVVKLFKGISFIPGSSRTGAIQSLLDRCINFILLHKVCYSSSKNEKIMMKHIDRLTFPNMYKSDFLEILWLLKREQVRSEKLGPALELLQSKQQPGRKWHLEKKISNMVTTIGEVNQPNTFITGRAREVLEFYAD